MRKKSKPASENSKQDLATDAADTDTPAVAESQQVDDTPLDQKDVSSPQEGDINAVAAELQKEGDSPDDAASLGKPTSPSNWFGGRFFSGPHDDTVSSVTRDVPRYKVSDQKEKQAFIAVLVLGVAFVFLTKLFGLLPTWIITGTSMVLVGGYAYFAYMMRNEGIRVDRAGDNAYYLGLVYTLTSMSVVLIRGDFGAGAAEQILSGFGVALGSTIAGIISRIILIQFREGVEDLERSAMVVLKNTVQDLEHALISSVERATAFSRVLEDHSLAVKDTFAASFKEIETTSHENVKEMSTAHIESQRALAEETKEILKSARDSMAGAVTHMAETSQIIRDGAKSEREEFGRFLQAISTFSAQLEKVQVPTDIITEFIRSLEEQRDHTRRIISDTDLLYTNLNDKSANLNRRLEDITADIQDLAKSIKDEHSSVSDVTHSLAALADEVKRSGTQISATSKSLNAGVDEFKKNSSAYVNTLAETANFLADEIGRGKR